MCAAEIQGFIDKFCGILLTSISAIRFEHGTPKVYTYYNSEGNRVHCTFCSICTTHAYHRDESRGNEVQVRTFPLLEAGIMGVDKEINVGERFSWVKKVDGAKRELDSGCCARPSWPTVVT
ncbi:hypothetical protein V1504DRAFT_88346 [Lipomyces starkeyi]